MIPLGHPLHGHPLAARAIADSRDRPAWMAKREGRIGGSDAGGFAKVESAHRYAKAKLGEPFGGNQYTRHGNDREARMLRAYHLEPNPYMFVSADDDRKVSTPDGILVTASGEVIIAEAKTTNKPFTAPPPRYLRQMLWNMSVMGATRCLFIWETHTGFVATDIEPESLWVTAADYVPETTKLHLIADAVLEGMAEARRFRQELA